MTNKINKAAQETQEPPVTDFESFTSKQHVLDQNRPFQKQIKTKQNKSGQIKTNKDKYRQIKTNKDK